jgi:TrmH family RNA methyltransferase
MITKAQVKHIRSLDDKKYRMESQTYVLEGDKMVSEALRSKNLVKELFATEEWLKQHDKAISEFTTLNQVDQKELSRISFQKHPNSALALMELPSEKKLPACGRLLLTDSIQDPGNMGSIIRIADWFGVDGILLYGTCVDPFSPKCVQSTMGSILRVNTFHVSLSQLKENYASDNIIGATLQGKPLRGIAPWTDGILAIGNESKGLSSEILSVCKSEIRIEGGGHAESLNAAVATGIICHALLC